MQHDTLSALRQVPVQAELVRSIAQTVMESNVLLRDPRSLMEQLSDHKIVLLSLFRSQDKGQLHIWLLKV